MATDFIDSGPQESNASQGDPQERRSSWDHPNDSLSLEPSSRHDEPHSRREILHTLADRYYAEKRRADDAERMLQELIIRMKTINEARLQALHDAAKSNEELKLYKIQLRTAQNEIYKAQDTIEAVDRQRYNAEKEAAKFRSKTRQLNEEILMLAAREEAWKLGLQEGLNRGRSNEENLSLEYAEEAEEDAVEDDVDSYDETISSNNSNTYRARPPSIQDRPSSRTHPSPPLVPLQLPSNPPTVGHSVHPSENIRPLSIRSGYTRPSSRQRATPPLTPTPLPGNRPSSSQSIRQSENVRPASIRSGYTRPSSRQHEAPSSSQAPVLGHQPPPSQSVQPVSVRSGYTKPSSTHRATPSLTPAPLPGNRPPSSQSIRPSENVQPASIRSGYTRPSSRQHATPSSTQVPLPGHHPPPSQSIPPSENVRPVSIRSGHTRPSSRQHVSPSFVPVPSTSNTRPSSPYRAPPDNFIPSLGADNKIRIPPPFEFQRAATTPERPVSPQLPTTAMSDSSQEAVMVPGPHAKAPQQHRSRYHHRHSSSESNSSSLSALDIINDRPPMGIGTPMTIIPEVASVQSSAIQLPDGDHHSRRQRSFGDNSMHTLNLDNSQYMEAPITHLRPHSRSSNAGSTRNAYLPGEARSGTSYDSSPPNITVQPSSRRTSVMQSGSTNASLHNATLASVLETQDPSMLIPENYDDTVASAMGTDPLTAPARGHASMEPDRSGAAVSAARVSLLPSNSLNVDAIMDSKKKGKKRKQ